MPYYCTVPRCTSMAGKAKNVSFHQFPRDEELAKLWNKILKRGKPYTKYSKVCSLHFTPEDYTITSVGKNKGQWRTLRKDAVPSQNLPSESPTPYQRKQWASWTRSPQANVLDPTIHQQVAQAIYMQTMLAMQAAGATDATPLNHSNDVPQLEPSEGQIAHTSNTPDSDILRGKHTNAHEISNSYKCTECLKCFKDPDVFILHKRSHIKNEKNGKENFNLNLTLQANPILANLLKTNTENSNIFDGNLISVESLFMTALAANMEGYMRNFASMIKGEDMDDFSRDRGSLGQDRGDLNHDRGDINHDIGDLNHDRGDVSNDSNIGFTRASYGQDRLEPNARGSYFQNGENTSQIDDLNCDRNMDDDSSAFNNDNADSNHDSGTAIVSENSNSNIFRDRITQLYRNNDAYDSERNIRYYENDSENNDRASQDSDVTKYDDRGVSNDRDMMGHDKAMMDDDRGMMGHDRGVLNHRYNGITNNDDSQGSNAICDSDLNESIDSHKLIIDETF